MNDKLSSLSRDYNTGYYGNNEYLDVIGKDFISPPKCRADEETLKCVPSRRNSCEKKDSLDLEYRPGNLTSFKNQYTSRDYLFKTKLDTNIKPDHECKYKVSDPSPVKFKSSLPPTTFSPTLFHSELSNKYKKDTEDDDYLNTWNTAKMFGSHTITEKPNERCPSPIAPAYANFELAKRMHSNNLDHQPLPDCVADLAFRKLQITGDHPGLALEIEPIASGVGIKTHNAGPTQCTKMKVYRPTTSGVIPRELNNNFTRSYSATPIDKKMGEMDLAICWDYKPPFEPPKPTHIDGSNDSAGPAVFSYVKTPRDEVIVNTGKSSGIFANTLEDINCLDKDTSRRKMDFVCRNNSTNECLTETVCPTFTGAHSAPIYDGVCHRLPESHKFKHLKSTPDVFSEQEYKTLRAKYLGSDWKCSEMPAENVCKRSGIISKARLNIRHKIAPETNCCSSACQPKRIVSKATFRAGMPRTDATGNYISSDIGCNIGGNHFQKVLVVPRPRNPHRKKSYDINTLVPPFKSCAGGAGEGGYPEHWRLSSVYQHAFKPLEYRRNPLLQTVYK